MTDTNQKQLGKTLLSIANQLPGGMDADDFRDYMLSFLFLRYLSDNYETAAEKELGRDYPAVDGETRTVPLALWYANNEEVIPAFFSPGLHPGGNYSRHFETSCYSANQL